MNPRKILPACVSLLCVPSAFAESWQPIGGTVGYYEGRDADNNLILRERPLFGAYAFDDGQFTQKTPGAPNVSPTSGMPRYAGYEFVLLDRPLTEQYRAGWGLSFENEAEGALAPRVDMANRTIDVRGAHVSVLGAGSPDDQAFNVFTWDSGPANPIVLPDPVPGQTWPTYPVAVQEPIPFVDNGDGTFTASWRFKPTDADTKFRKYFGDGLPISMTFAVAAPTAPVPEPATVWLFGAGIGLLGFVARKHRVRVDS